MRHDSGANEENLGNAWRASIHLSLGGGRRGAALSSRSHAPSLPPAHAPLPKYFGPTSNSILGAGSQTRDYAFAGILSFVEQMNDIS